jgi:parallel beta-helix repeat protein
MPQRGIHAFYQYSDRWTIENNEITGCRSGVSVPNASVLRRNRIHHNNGDSRGGLIPNGGYIATSITNSLFEDNEISYNGSIQKVLLTTNVTFRNNYVHHNAGVGIWYDGDNVGALIEGNLIEDNSGDGIHYEISGQGIIRNNTVRRSGQSAIFMSTSRDVEIHANTLENNFRAVNLFVSCGNVHPRDVPYAGAIGWDLRNNNVHDNAVVVGDQSGVIGNALGYDASCTTAQAAAYLNGSKGNVFQSNRYTVATLAGQWWYWGTFKTWSDWQTLGQDTQGTASQR